MQENLQISGAKVAGFIAAFVIMFIIWALPTPEGLPVVGQRMIGILIFAVILWITEAVSYPASSFIIIGVAILSLGFAPLIDPQVAKILNIKGDLIETEKTVGMLVGTKTALKLAIGGFANSSWALVMAALFLAAAMMITGLDKRIALFIMSKVGTKAKNLLIGVLITGCVLSFFIPSTTARVSALVPIVIGIIRAFGVKQGSTFAAIMMIAVSQIDSLWNVGIKTAAAQNMVAIGFMNKLLGKEPTWLEWFIAAAPFAALMSVVLYFVLTKMMPSEVDEIKGGQEVIAKMQKEMGKISFNELKLMFICVAMLFFWITEKQLHSIDTTSVTLIGISIMFMPIIGVMSWKEAVNKINWGTIILFGVGISVGTALLNTGAATWMAHWFVDAFGLATSSGIFVIGVLSFFLIIIHLGFASATALASAIIPIVIAVLTQLNEMDASINVMAMTMILQFSVSFGFILPVNAPQNMITFSTGYYSSRDFIKTGVVIMAFAYVMLLVFSATYWKWLGLVG